MSDNNLRKSLIRLAHSNPELRADLLPLIAGKTAAHVKMASAMYQKVSKIAAAFPETRKHLMPILRQADGCACPDRLAEAMDSDEALGGRTWGNPDPNKPQDDGTPNYKSWPDSPPAGEDGSAQRKVYNNWFRENACPKHKTNCGM